MDFPRYFFVLLPTFTESSPACLLLRRRRRCFFSLFFSFSFWKLKNLFFSQEMALAMFVIFFAFPVVVVVVST